MIVLTAYVYLKPESVVQALDACRKVRAASVKEKGCLVYNFFQSAEDPTRLVFVEEWESKDALDTHFQQDAFKEFFAEMGDYLLSEPDMRIFEANRV